jgi:HK97 gp10 family phage protein
MKGIKLTSYVDSVVVDIKKAEKKALTKAAAHIVKSVKAKIGEVGIKKHTGNLKKGVGSNVFQNNAVIGFGPPAHHAHLLEFGTKQRQTKTGKVTGHIRPTPILAPVFEEEAGAVKEILEDRWLA